ncbi:MAG: FtsQ-type POTRA domain-containing protein [Candidatus Peribacteraceae bacterium]|nr:FtsQ-type POTRA domain-containing protein [Candidatus Peribacteraceae bacterium]
MTQISFRQRKLNRLLGRIFHRRRREHLATRVFRAERRVKNFLTVRQKIYLVLAVIAVGALIGFVRFSGFFAVTKVSIARSSLDLPLEAIELSIRELAFGKNIFSVNADLLAEAVKVVQPDIARVEIHKKYPREISVEVFKFPIEAVLRTNSESIFLNENGYRVIGDLPDRDTLQLVVGEDFDLSDPSTRVIDPDHLEFIREAVFYFESLTNLKILNTKYFPISREAHLKTEKNFDIWLDFASDYKSQIDKLIAAADVLKIGEQKYEYVDLRVRGKIFYKKR